jgi:hypothetical protein
MMPTAGSNLKLPTACYSATALFMSLTVPTPLVRAFTNRPPLLARSRTPLMVDWPWSTGSGGGDTSEGKFVRHNELAPGCAPLGIVTAGLGEDELEALAETIEGIWQGADVDGPVQHVPIAVLADVDLRLRLRDVLATLSARDSVLPDRLASPRVPLVLLSGFNTVQTSATVRAVRALDLRGGLDNRQKPMLAVAVPNALDKTLRILIEELEGDQRENAPLGGGSQ